MFRRNAKGPNRGPSPGEQARRLCGAKRDRVHIHEQEIATEVPFPSVVYPVGVGRALVSPVAYEHLEGHIKRSHFQVQEPIYRRLGERGIILPKMYRRPAEIDAASHHAAALRADVLLGTVLSSFAHSKCVL